MSSSATYQAGVELLLVGGIVQDLDAMAGHEPPCARRRDDRGRGGHGDLVQEAVGIVRKADEHRPTLCHFLTYRCAATRFPGPQGSRRHSRGAKKRV